MFTDTNISSGTGSKKARPPRLSFFAGLPFTLVLFVVWIILSGKFDLFHLGVGLVTAQVASRFAQHLVALPPRIGALDHAPVKGVVWVRVVSYIPWLAWQVILSSIHIAVVVLHPRLPIAPRILTISGGLRHTLARLTLANSITLTPGTVTVDVQEDEFVVHALTEATAESLTATKDAMPQRVRNLFEGGSSGLSDTQSESSG